MARMQTIDPPVELFFDLKAERAVIGALLIDPAQMDDPAVRALSPADFHNEQCGGVFLGMCNLDRQGKPFDDPIILGDVLKTAGTGDAGDVITMSADTPMSLYCPHYAGIVKGLAQKRLLQRTLENALSDLVNNERETDARDLATILAGDLRNTFGANGDKPGAHSWTLDDLLKADFPDPTWCVPGLIPTGLVILAGRPKVGKSWLALQIAIAKGAGDLALGQRVDPGHVLYIALEDSPRRLKDRLKRQRAEPGGAVVFVNEWATLGAGGLARLQDAIEQDGYNLVIIDTLSRILGMADQLDLAQMNNLVGALQRLAQQGGCTILAVDHHRKSNGFDADPIDDLMGSTGKSAVCDAAFGLYKKGGKREATLKIKGREIEEKEMALQWDSAICCWQCLGDADSVREDSAQGDVLTAIKKINCAGELATSTTIAQYLDKNQGYMARLLYDLVDKGRIKALPKVGTKQPYGVIDD